MFLVMDLYGFLIGTFEILAALVFVAVVSFLVEKKYCTNQTFFK